MLKLESSIQPYAWGSRTAIAELCGRGAPSETPEAEMWIGAHPLLPSHLQNARPSALNEFIASRPAAVLGNRVAERFGALPFLLKLLAADRPLSLQAHPSREQARRGFAREEALGIPREAPHRTYRDDNHKPELLCALGPFEALSGFRPYQQTRELFACLRIVELNPLVQCLDKNDLEGAVACLMELDEGKRLRAVQQVKAALANLDATPFRNVVKWSRKAAEAYPSDVGAILMLLLNHIELKAGEAIFLEAGNLHAYLEGFGVEVMANSDNVLRGGLTSKHVDVDELRRVLRYEPLIEPRIAPRRFDNEFIYPTAATEFELSRVVVTQAQSFGTKVSGPEIVLCVRGKVRSAGLELVPGEASFVSAQDEGYLLQGSGEVFRVRVP